MLSLSSPKATLHMHVPYHRTTDPSITQTLAGINLLHEFVLHLHTLHSCNPCTPATPALLQPLQPLHSCWAQPASTRPTSPHPYTRPHRPLLDSRVRSKLPTPQPQPSSMHTAHRADCSSTTAFPTTTCCIHICLQATSTAQQPPTLQPNYDRPPPPTNYRIFSTIPTHFNYELLPRPPQEVTKCFIPLHPDPTWNTALRCTPARHSNTSHQPSQ
jgi:hypothetical protein